MKKKLTDNLGLKIGSVLFAALLWLLVTNINNPATTRRSTNIPVTIINEDVLTSQGKIYEVLDNSDTLAWVSVTGPGQIMGNISDKDLIAVADMKKLTTDNTIPIELSTAQYGKAEGRRTEEHFAPVKSGYVRNFAGWLYCRGCNDRAEPGKGFRAGVHSVYYRKS